MNIVSRSKVMMFVLLVVTIGLLSSTAQAQGPRLVRLTGTLSPIGGKGVTEINIFTVFIQGKGKIWVFNVKDAQDLSGVETGWDILNSILPSELYFRGPQDLIASLERPQVAGKLITLEGYIYVADNTLQVTTINNAS